MENLKKYFEFSGTISGTNYFLRNLFAVFVAFIGGFSLGWGIGSETMFFTILGLIILAPALWFNICTVYKRASALFPEYAALITGALVLLQLLDSISVIFSLIALVIGLTLIFKNSGIEEHNG
jgi:uncharacterized membrane protein YhaH (DUF805 family)